MAGAAALGVALTAPAWPSARAGESEPSPWLNLSLAPPADPAAAEPVPPAESVERAAAAAVPVGFRLIAPPGEPPAGPDGMSFATAQSVACLATGGAATAAALAFGWQNVTNLISGGVVPAAGPGAVALGLFGVVFTSFCAIGQALTPLYLDAVGAETVAGPRQPPPSVPPEVACPSCNGPRRRAPGGTSILPLPVRAEAAGRAPGLIQASAGPCAAAATTATGFTSRPVPHGGEIPCDP